MILKRDHIRQFQNGSNQCVIISGEVVPLVIEMETFFLRGKWNNIIFDVQNKHCLTEMSNTMNELIQI